MNRPLALAQLAGTVARQGDTSRTLAIVTRAREIAPDDPEVAAVTARALARVVPKWHFGIVRDKVRNAAYEAALHRAAPGKRVFEIGAGTGLLSMMAARAGAQSVVACEMNPALVDVAQQTVARNGLADRVRIVAKKSFDVDAEADLGGRADVLVSEIVSNDMLGEDVLAVMSDAFKRLLRPDTQVIPARGIVRVALAHDANFPRRRAASASGFDLSPLNGLATDRYHLKPGDKRLTLMSAPADLFTFDFRPTAAATPTRVQAELTAQGGIANGIVQWILLEMDEDVRYENAPAPGIESCWDIQFHPLPSERKLADGETVAVHGSHNGQTLFIWAGA